MEKLLFIALLIFGCNSMATDYFYKKIESPLINSDVLLIHGALSNKNYWLNNADLMNELKSIRPSSITAVSLMGRGISPLQDECSVNNHIDEIRSVIKELKLKNITLISHSFGTALSVGLSLKEKENIQLFIGGDYFPIVPPFSEGWLSWINENIQDFDIDRKLPECLVRDVAYEDYRERLKELNLNGLMIRGTKEGGMLSEENLVVWLEFSNLSHFASDSGHNVYSNPKTIEKVSSFISNSFK